MSLLKVYRSQVVALCSVEKKQYQKSAALINFLSLFEDFDLSIRLNEIAKIAYHPKMRIVHGGGNAARKGIWHIIYFIRSAWSFYSKYGWRWY